MRKWMKLLFVVYILFVIKVIIFKYPYAQLYAIVQTWQKDVILEGLGSANFMPFKTIKMYIEYADKLNSVENLAGNILVFVPFGILFPLMRSSKSSFPDVFAHSLVLVLGIEIFQLFSAFGAFDVDDIILNCFGALLGYVVYRKSRDFFPAFDKIMKMEEEEYGTYLEKN
ncbi:MAG: VanZ family protein [Ruminococcus sp.]|nr:VanZ family protein [Ruminococcus sp.]